MKRTDATKRFARRADHYAKHRPSYPAALFDFLRDELGLLPGQTVADLGSGTGILAHCLVQRGLMVFAVEPSPDMRVMAEALLGKCPKFHSVDAPAEATTLDTASIDFAIAGQAFHWFDAHKTRTELHRILKPRCTCALVWNARLLKGSPFLKAYESFLATWGLDYAQVKTTYEDPQAIATVLGHDYGRRTFPNYQDLDRDGLRGRVLSSSYMPSEDHPRATEMLAALDGLFDAHDNHGTLRIEYATNLYYGRIPN